MPELSGEADITAEIAAGEPYTYTASFYSRCSACTDPVCGEYFHLAVGIYDTMCDFPCYFEWIYMSEEMYQVGGDPIVIGPVDLVLNLAQ